MIDRLEAFWSPDQISGYLRKLAIHGYYVCRETIYSFIYSAEGRELKLYRYLKKAFKNRRKRHRRRSIHSRGIPEKLGIKHRPSEVNNRDNFGHWEGDLMIFRREYGKANLTTLVERKSRYCLIVKNQDRKSIPVMSAIRDKLKALPQHSRRTVTFDRGSEFTAWRLLDKHIAGGAYYCDPQAPWQKGSNENTNGRLRRFLPSETNLNELTMRQINDIADKINHIPRKCLDYRTPHEVFYNHLHQHHNQISCLT